MFLCRYSHRRCVSSSLKSHYCLDNLSMTPSSQELVLPSQEVALPLPLPSQEVCLCIAKISSWSLTMCLCLFSHRQCVSALLKSHHGHWKCAYDSGLTGSMCLYIWHLTMALDKVLVTLTSQEVHLCIANISWWSLTISLWLWPRRKRVWPHRKRVWPHRKCLWPCRKYVSAWLTSNHGHLQCTYDSGLTGSEFGLTEHVSRLTGSVSLLTSNPGHW